MTFIVRTCRIINLLFIAEMLLLALGLKLKLISYGIEVQAALTEVFIMLGLFLSIVTFLALRKPETKAKKVLVCITAAIMVFAGLSLVLDNSFRVLT